MVSDIPWAGPLGAVRVGRVKGQFIANPTHAEMAESDLDLVYVGNANDIVMYEGSAKEISEADFNAALKFGHEAMPAADRRAKGTGRQGRQEETRNHAQHRARRNSCRKPRSSPATVLCPRCSRPANSPAKPPCKAIQDEVGAKLVEKFGAEKVTDFVIKDAFYYIQKEAVRGLILNNGKRLDGRAFDVVRPISSEVGILPRAHGSALFCRGETQARHARHARHRRRRAGIRFLHRRRQRKEIHPALQLPEFLRRRNRPHQRSGPARNRPRRARRTLHRTDAAARRIIPTPSASPARSWNPTAPPRWRPFAAARWR